MELGRLLPHAKALMYVLLAHLLTASCSMGLNALIRNTKGWEKY